jgi:hypothetical protein
MPQIALIKKNRCQFDRLEEFAVPLLYTSHSEKNRLELKTKLNDYLWSVIEPYIQFINIDPTEDFMTHCVMNLISDFAGTTPDHFFYHTEPSFSSPKRFLEIIHCQPLWQDYKHGELENINNLGCLASLKHTVIENDVIIMANKYDLSSPYYTQITDITKSDILRIIRRRFIMTAILIKTDQIVKYYYQNPSYLVSKVFNMDPNDRIERLPFNLMKYNLVAYFKHEKTKPVNPIATRINGHFRLHGDVLILHELEDKIYGNLSVAEIAKLEALSYGRLYDRQPTEEETYTLPTVEADEEGNPVEKKTIPIWSRYITVQRRLLNRQAQGDLCINCDKKLSHSITCDRCYRVKFCSSQCQREYGNFHYDDCINPN